MVASVVLDLKKITVKTISRLKLLTKPFCVFVLSLFCKKTSARKENPIHLHGLQNSNFKENFNKGI